MDLSQTTSLPTSAFLPQPYISGSLLSLSTSALYLRLTPQLFYLSPPTQTLPSQPHTLVFLPQLHTETLSFPS